MSKLYRNILVSFLVIIVLMIAVFLSIVLFTTAKALLSITPEISVSRTFENYAGSLKKIINPHILMLTIIVLISGVMIPLFVTLWSGFLATLFEVVKYIKDKNINEETIPDYPEIVNQSVQASKNLRILYIGGLICMSTALVILIASIFTSPLCEGDFSVILLMLSYLLLLIVCIVFVTTIYFTLISYSPFPRLSKLIKRIQETPTPTE